MALDLSEKFDRILLRAEELRHDLSSGLGGEAFSRASRELSELEPVVARIDEWPCGRSRGAGRRADAGRPGDARDGRSRAARAARAIAGAGARDTACLAAARRGGRAQRHPGNPPRRGRRRSRAVRRRTVRRLPEIRRAARLALRTAGVRRKRAGRAEGRHRRGDRPQRVRAAEIRIRRAPRAARAHHRDPGPHTHQHGDRGRAAGSRGGGRAGQRERFAQSTSTARPARAGST